MVSVLALGAVDRGLEHRSGKPKGYKIGICCFSVKYATLRNKTKKDCLSRNQKKCPSGETYLRVDCCSSELAI